MVTMRLLAAASLLVIAAQMAMAALPPGYDEELFCPEGYCLAEKKTRPGLTGPRAHFHQCLHIKDKRRTRPRGWGIKIDIKIREEWINGGYHNKTCLELGVSAEEIAKFIANDEDDMKRRRVNEKLFFDRNKNATDQNETDTLSPEEAAKKKFRSPLDFEEEREKRRAERREKAGGGPLGKDDWLEKREERRRNRENRNDKMAEGEDARERDWDAERERTLQDVEARRAEMDKRRAEMDKRRAEMEERRKEAAARRSKGGAMSEEERAKHRERRDEHRRKHEERRRLAREEAPEKVKEL